MATTPMAWRSRFAQPPPGGQFPLVLTQRRVYILPTRPGLLFAATLVTMLLGCINYNLGLGFVLTFLLGGCGVLTMLHTYRNLAQLRLRPGQVEPVFAGDPAQFPVHLDNPGQIPRLSLRLECGAVRSAWFDVPAAGQQTACLAFPTLQRGVLVLPRIRVRTTFPLGLFNAWSNVDMELQALVYPRPTPGPVELPQPVGGNGGVRQHGPGQEDFAGLRDYHPGDSLRHVAWRTEARDQPLMTKQFSGQSGGEIWLDWAEMSPRLGTEERLRLLARQLLDAQALGASVGLRLPQGEFSPKPGPEHLHRCLGALALFPAH